MLTGGNIMVTPGQAMTGFAIFTVALLGYDQFATYLQHHQDTFAGGKRPVSSNDHCAYAVVPTGRLWWVTPVGNTPPKYLVRALIPEVATGKTAGEAWREEILPLHPTAECPR